MSIRSSTFLPRLESALDSRRIAVPWPPRSLRSYFPSASRKYTGLPLSGDKVKGTYGDAGERKESTNCAKKKYKGRRRRDTDGGDYSYGYVVHVGDKIQNRRCRGYSPRCWWVVYYTYLPRERVIRSTLKQEADPVASEAKPRGSGRTQYGRVHIRITAALVGTCGELRRTTPQP